MLADPPSGLEKLALRGAWSDLELLRDLLMSEAFDVVQNQNGAAARRQKRHRALKIEARAVRVCLRGPRPSFEAAFFAVVERFLHPPSALAQTVEAKVADDAQKPGRKRRASPEIPQAHNGARPGFLGRVLGFGRLPEQP